MKPLYPQVPSDLVTFQVEPGKTCCLACALIEANIAKWFIDELLLSSKKVKDVHEGDTGVQQMLSRLSLRDKSKVLHITKLILSSQLRQGDPLVVHRRFYQRELLQINATTEPGFFSAITTKRGSTLQIFYKHVTLSYMQSFSQDLCCQLIQAYYRPGIYQGLHNVPMDVGVKISVIRNKCEVQITEATATGGSDAKFSTDTKDHENVDALMIDIGEILSLTRRVSVIVLMIHQPDGDHVEDIVKMSSWLRLFKALYGDIDDITIILIMNTPNVWANRRDSLCIVNKGLSKEEVSDVIWDVVSVNVE